MLAVLDPVALVVIVAGLLVMGVVVFALWALVMVLRMVFWLVALPFRLIGGMARAIADESRQPVTAGGMVVADSPQPLLSMPRPARQVQSTPVAGPAPATPPALPGGVKRCRNPLCQATNPAKAKFCSRCGTAIGLYEHSTPIRGRTMLRTA